MRALAGGLVLLLAGCGGASKPAAAPAAPPTVLVGLERTQRGSQPEWLDGYGSAAPALGGTRTISVPQAGQVTELAVAVGTAVAAGQALATFVTDPAAVGAYQQAVTALATAQKQRATTAQLLTQQLATRDQLSQLDKTVTDAQTALAALRQQGAGQPTRRLTAPFAGVVTAVSVAQGDRTAPGAPLVTVARSGSIIATVGLDPAQATRVRPGQAARVRRLNGGPVLSGQVLRVSGVLNPRTRLTDISLSLPAGSVVANEALQGEVAVALVAGWLVPHRAVVTANGPARVFQLVGDKARAVPVTVKLPGESIDVVDGSLDPSHPLIVAGAYQVTDGAAVRWK